MIISRKTLLSIVILLFSLSQYKCLQGQSNPSYAIEFNILTTALEELHPSLYVNQNKFDYNKLKLETLNQLSDSISNSDAVYLVQDFLYQIGDGHCGITSIYDHKPSHVLPFSVYIIEEKLFIKNYPADTTQNGSEIQSINGIKSDSLINKLKVAFPNDGNRNLICFCLQPMFGQLYNLFIDQSKVFQIEINDQIHYWDAVNEDENPFIELFSKSWSYYEPYAPRVKGCSVDISENYGIYTLNSFQEKVDKIKIKDEFENLILSLNEKNIKNLIIDLRFNMGGNPYLALEMASCFMNESKPVFSQLLLTTYKKISNKKALGNRIQLIKRHWGAKREALFFRKRHFDQGLKKLSPNNKVRFDGDIYVIIGSMSLSATTMFCSYIENIPNVTFVGEETLGSTNYFWAHDHLELNFKNLGITTSFALQLVEVTQNSSLKEKPTGVKIDQFINYSIEERMNLVDKEKDWILNQINSSSLK